MSAIIVTTDTSVSTTTIYEQKIAPTTPATMMTVALIMAVKSNRA
jgi:hypothetical protein